MIVGALWFSRAGLCLAYFSRADPSTAVSCAFALSHDSAMRSQSDHDSIPPKLFYSSYGTNPGAGEYFLRESALGRRAAILTSLLFYIRNVFRISPPPMCAPDIPNARHEKSPFIRCHSHTARRGCQAVGLHSCSPLT